MYFQEAKKYQDMMVEDRRYLHAHPEITYALTETIAYLKRRLQSLHIAVKDIGRSGLVGLIGQGEPCILLRADMDALPMKERSGLPFASATDYAHTCGHDLHMAMLLGAAAVLKDHEQELKGTVKLLFQPAEEDGSGALVMVEAGVLRAPDVSAAFGLHVLANEPCGRICYRSGVEMASNDFFTVTIRGKSSHGSAPHLGIDPIAIASHVILNLQMLNAREIDAKERFVITFGALHAGSTHNVIPEEAVLKGTVRCFKPAVREQVRRRFTEIIEATTQMYGAESTIDFTMSVPNIVNDEALTRQLTEAFQAVFGEQVDSDYPPLSISEDFSQIGTRVPSTFVLLGAQQKDRAPSSLHAPDIVFDEDALAYGAALHVIAAMTYLA